jgi:hypothetical protein
MASHGTRSILGDPNPYDNGLKAASYVDGGDDSLSACQPYTSPLSVTDQTSDETSAERQGLQDAYKAAQRASSRIGADAGAGGTVVAPAGQLEQLGRIADADGAGPGDVIAPKPPVVRRADGADSGTDGTGKSIA